MGAEGVRSCNMFPSPPPLGSNIMHYMNNWLLFKIIHLLVHLLSYDAGLNQQDNQGLTPLHVAVEAGQKTTVEFLLEAGANSSILSNAELAPLHKAVENNNPQMLEVHN